MALAARGTAALLLAVALYLAVTGNSLHVGRGRTASESVSACPAYCTFLNSQRKLA